MFRLLDAGEQRIYLRIVLPGIALSVEVHWVVPKEDITHDTVEAAVFFLKGPMLLASFDFGLHRSV